MKEEYVFENSFSRSGTLCTSCKGASRDTPWVLLLSKGFFLFLVLEFSLFFYRWKKEICYELIVRFKTTSTYICITYRRCVCVAYIWYMMLLLYSTCKVCVYNMHIICDACKEFMWYFCIACIEYMWYFCMYRIYVVFV